MDEIVQTLLMLGFNKVEAQVYVALVSVEKMGGYQLSKQLNISRPSVYTALENLLRKGFISSIPGDVSEYKAVDPEIIFDEISKKFNFNLKDAKDKLTALKVPLFRQDRFSNIEGKQNLILQVNRTIHQAEKEIIFDCSIPLEFFEEELRSASKRGVRIILFSWKYYDLKGIPIEFTTGADGNDYCSEEKILLVSDLQHCVIGSNDRSEFVVHKNVTEKFPNGENDFLGMASDNRLLVNIVTEHIHFDIYLQRLKKKFGNDFFSDEIHIGSLMEKGL